MGIISSEGRDIMPIKKLLIVLSAVIVCTASAITVYFMFENNFSVSLDDSSVLAANASPVSFVDSALITSDTQIVKRIRYSKGIPVVLEEALASGPENLGMNRKTASDYYKSDGYLIMEFSSEKVVMLKELPTWPPNYYVVKEDEGVINTYYTDSQGNPNFLKTSELELEQIPAEDQADLRKGLAFKTLQQIDLMLEEYDS